MILAEPDFLGDAAERRLLLIMIGEPMDGLLDPLIGLRVVVHLHVHVCALLRVHGRRVGKPPGLATRFLR